jgi:hypothetical protein
MELSTVLNKMGCMMDRLTILGAIALCLPTSLRQRGNMCMMFPNHLMAAL